MAVSLLASLPNGTQILTALSTDTLPTTDISGTPLIPGAQCYIIDQAGRVDGFTGTAWATVRTGGALRISDKASEQELIDNTGTYLYTGYAPFGVATSTAGWQVFRQAVTAGGLGEAIAADGDTAYDNIWDNRASLTYPAGV